jgi:hypothetical protein
MSDPIGFVILAVIAVGLIALGLRMRADRPRNPEEALERAALDAERDRVEGRASEMVDRTDSRPGGSGSVP